MLPANDGGSHLDSSATPDSFTCTGTQDANLAALVATGADVTIDTSVKTITVQNGGALNNVRWGSVFTQSGGAGPAIVAHLRSVTLNAGTTVTVTGANALILLVDQDFDASGTGASPTVISVASRLGMPDGAGAAPPATYGGNGPFMTFSGGGGGGHVGHGGAGEGATMGTMGGSGGSIFAVGGTSERLVAGGPGGTGDQPLGAAWNGYPGIGGGALQISACGTIKLDNHVLINASGMGGAGGAPRPDSTHPGGGGGGGGAGGTILLEASAFQCAGMLVSNGGGGGGAGSDPTFPGMRGADWGGNSPSTASPSDLVPGGGGGLYGTGGAGGSVAMAVGGDGTNGLMFPFGGGAGGGAVGAIYVNVPACQPVPTGLNASPIPKTSSVCVTQDGSPVACTYP